IWMKIPNAAKIRKIPSVINDKVTNMLIYLENATHEKQILTNIIALSSLFCQKNFLTKSKMNCLCALRATHNEKRMSGFINHSNKLNIFYFLSKNESDKTGNIRISINYYLKVLNEICLNTWATKHLSVLGSASYCIFNLALILENYFDYNITNERMASIQFPTVSFCNKNPLNLQKTQSKTLHYLDLIQAFNLAKVYNNTFSLMKETNFIISIDIIDYSFDLDEMLINCELNGITCNKNDFEHFMLPEFGNCYKFNSGKNLLGNKIEIQNSSIPGKQNGLRLELFTGFLDQDLDLIRSSGIHLFIHNHSTVIFNEFDSINLPNGFETDIVVSQQHSYKLSKPYSNCIKDPASFNSFQSDLYRKSIELYGRYQQKTCLIMCYHEFIKETFGCYYPGAIGASSSTLCEYQVFLLATNAYKNFSNSGQSSKCFDMCPNECETIKVWPKV
ncbi:amiloride-sensitive sodium channel subunit delta, partial [Brachionus plicatilis]